MQFRGIGLGLFHRGSERQLLATVRKLQTGVVDVIVCPEQVHVCLLYTSHMKRLNLDILNVEGQTVTADKKIYVVDIPSQEFEFRR